MPIDEYYSLEEARRGREESLERLRANRASARQAAQELYSQEQQDLTEEEFERATNPHYMAGRGAMTGLTLSGGNPYGAAVGGAIGLLGGGIGAYKARRDAGEGRGEALWKTFTSATALDPRAIPGALKGGLSGAGGAAGVGAAGKAVSGYQAKQAAERRLAQQQAVQDLLGSRGGRNDVSIDPSGFDRYGGGEQTGYTDASIYGKHKGKYSGVA
jgi:hypothetical protein